jgi:hypothetical protein
MLASKLRRHMLAWFDVSRSRKAQQLSLLSLRRSVETRRFRSTFVAWLLAMQRTRVARLAESNAALSHELGAMSARMKVLAHENNSISASLTERLYAAADSAERDAEFARKDAALQQNLAHEKALRDKLQQYEQREYELSQSIHDTKHLLTQQIGETRTLAAQLHTEQSLRARFMRDLESSAASHRALLSNVDLMLDQTAQVMLSSNFRSVDNSKAWVVAVTNRLRAMLQTHHAASTAELDAVGAALTAANNMAQMVAQQPSSPVRAQINQASERALASSPTKAMFAPLQRDAYGGSGSGSSYLPNSSPPPFVSPPPLSTTSSNSLEPPSRFATVPALSTRSAIPTAAATVAPPSLSSSLSHSHAHHSLLNDSTSSSSAFPLHHAAAASATGNHTFHHGPNGTLQREYDVLNKSSSSTSNGNGAPSSALSQSHTTGGVSASAATPQALAPTSSFSQRIRQYESELERELRQAEAMSNRATTAAAVAAADATSQRPMRF